MLTMNLMNILTVLLSIINLSSQMATLSNKVLKNGDQIFYSLTEKESESKIGFNTRLLVLVDDKFFGYIREKDFNKKDIDGSVDPNKIKKKILTKNLRRILNIGREITVMINDYDKNNKLTSLKWLFRMETERLADSWVEVLEKQNSPMPSRKTTEQKQIEREVSISKSPSIKEFVKQTQASIKQKEANKRGNEEQKKQKQQIKMAPRSIDNRPEDALQKKQGSRDIFAQIKQRQSDMTFSFKPDIADEMDQSSPPRKQQQIQMPHPMLEKIRKAEANLSSHLQEKVDFVGIQRELSQYKRSRREKTGQFKQLNENITNRQRDLLNSNFTNYFRQPFGRIDDRKFKDFYNFCEMKTSELLIQNFEDEIALDNWENHLLAKNGVLVKIIKTQIKQIPGNSNICDEGLLKRYLNQEKNSNYLWRIISQNDTLCSTFYIPMSCIVECRGVIVSYTCMFKSFQEDPANVRDLSQYFEVLCECIRISKTTLQNRSNIKFTKISPSAFAISEVNQLLPRLVSTNTQIRPEMFMQITEFGQEKGFSAKVSRREEEHQNRYLKRPIDEAINMLTKSLNRLEEYVIHPSQFSTMMHSYGLNMAQLHQIHNKVENSFMRSIIITQAATRSFKTIYRKKMQEMLLNIQATSQKPQPDNQQTLSATTKTLLNILLGRSEETSALWEMVTLHSQVNFKIVIDREGLNKGYLFLGLEYQLNLRIRTLCTTSEKIFQADGFVNDLRFGVKIRPCELYWIRDQVAEMSVFETAQYFMRSLNLDHQAIPFYIHQQSPTVQKLQQSLSLCYPPNSPQLKYLPIYRDSDDPSQKTVLHYRKKITQIKWQIKKQQSQININAIQAKIDALKAQLKFYFGLYHPFYTELYDIVIALSQNQGDWRKAEEYSKVSFANVLQLCAGNTMHLRLANNYYQKGELYVGWGKINQAIAAYRKAKNILEFNELTKAKEFASIQVKLAQLHLYKGKDQQAARLLVGSLELYFSLIGLKLFANQNRKDTKPVPGLAEISEDDQLTIYTEIANCFQLLNRCCESGESKNQELISNCLIFLQAAIDPQLPLNQIDLPDQIAVKLLKILAENFFFINRKFIDREFFNFVENICDSLHDGSPNVDPHSALTQLKTCILNKALLETMDGFDRKAKQFILHSKNMKIKQVSNRSLENFENIIRSLVIVFGESFILGVLNDSHRE